ncbi:DUF3466 family protein [Kangiella sediminilitoris]|uniref:Extracellular repeat protein, HAF family n=1 Tax=Kangiella sediminilitoris TaxID=1144748 RepID=A0A1B3BA47_9GAMM|nr:DUF3466 family protein [Kangiella sediminilitoris]AOE49692.1 hypothetical protein KS2013_971 [Kangiella sediminilitoris]
MKLLKTKTILTLSLLTVFSNLQAAPYEIVDLGGLDGNASVARDINEAGVSVGYANGPLKDNGFRTFNSHGVQFDESGNIDFGVLTDGTISDAFGINDAMVAVGLSNEISEVEENGVVDTVSSNFAVIFEGGVVTKIPPKDRLNGTTAYAINNNGLILISGDYDVDPEDDTGPVERGFVYDRNNDTYSMAIPISDGANRASALTDINDSNQVIGFSVAIVNDVNTVRSFIASADDLSQLTELPTINNRAIFAQGLNSSGEIVGNTFIDGTRNQFEAFYIDSNAAEPEVNLLGFFEPEFNHSQANDINNNGQVVGRALVSSPTLGEFAAFLYEGGEMKNLNELIACNTGWKLTEATAINDSGQIVGFGSIDGEVRAFRLDPTGGAVEECGTDNSRSGGGSFPYVMVALLALLGIRRKYS